MRRWSVAALVLASGLVSATCNVFVSLDRCDTDADCSAGRMCDPEGRFCVARDDAGIPDTGIDTSTTPEASAEGEAAPPPPPCNLSKPYEAITLVKGLESSTIFSARFTPNEKTVLLSVLNGGPEEFRADLFTAERADTTSPFTLGLQIPVVNTSVAAEYWPTLTPDGLLLFFESSRSLEKDGGQYTNDHARIWSTDRVTPNSDFREPTIPNLFRVEDTSAGEAAPYLHPGGRSLYFLSYARPGKGEGDIFVAELNSIGVPSAIKNVEAVNTPAGEHMPVISFDDTVLYFAREEPVTTIRNIYVSTRTDPKAEFGAAVPIDELNTEHEEFPSWVSNDRCRLYFLSNRPISGGPDAAPGEFRLWVAEKGKN